MIAPRHGAGLRTIALVVVLAAGAPAWSAQGDDVAQSYALSAWTADLGLPPGDVLAMTQDVEGYLWLGTTGGLVRFDGFQFVQWGDRGEAPLPGSSVPVLLGARDGSLWVGFGNQGGVSQIRTDGRVVDYSAREGLPAGPVTALIEDREGVIWIGGRGGLSKLQGGRWARVGRADGLPEVEVSSLHEDAHGAVWVGTAVGVYRRAAGEPSFQLDDGGLYVQDFTESDSGAIWVTHSQEIIRKLDASQRRRYAAPVRLPTAGWRLLRDSRGFIWIAALGGGLLRAHEDAAAGDVLIERFSYEHKIIGSPRSLFEDREHSIWVGMRGGGLLRLSESLLTAEVPLDGLTNDGVRALAVAADGSLWVATGHSLNRFDGDRREVYDVAQTLALHVDERGGTWVATAQSVGRFHDGQLRPVPIPARIRTERIMSLTTDRGGGLWVCSIDQGVFRWHDGALNAFEEIPAVTGRPCSFLKTDARGRVWVGFASGGGLAVYEDGQFRMYAETDGLASGGIVAIYEDRSAAVWVTTATGLSRFQDGQITTVTGAHGLPGRFVPSIVEDEQGYLWLGVNSGSGMVRFSQEEVDAVAQDRRYQVQYTLYDLSDGLQGELHWWSRPAAVLGRQGMLWFVTGTGMAVLDPRRLPEHQRPAPARIDRVTLNGRALGATPGLALPAATSALSIEYGALSLAAASKIRFRYQLEGFSPDWVDAESRREVSYADLRPGAYRFRVVATNYGTSTESEAVWNFSIRPPFYRAPSFYATIVLVSGALLWLAWWLRLRAVRHHFSLVVAERARVSREIHDTLLQSLGAMGLEIEAIASQLDTSQASTTQALRRLRRQVVQSVREARQSIWELRSPSFDVGDLVQALREIAERAAAGRAVPVGVSVSGQPRKLPADAERQLLRIAQEAVYNAVGHGKPSRVQIDVNYGREALTLRVSDDGLGFATDTVVEHARGEHLGLVNMQERAEQVGGRLRIDSQPGRGTTIEATVPLSRAS